MCEKQNIELASAMRSRDLNRMRDIVQKYAPSYSSNPQPWPGAYSLLLEAIICKYTDIAEVLLTNGCKINSRNKESSNTPLRLAVMNGLVKIVDILLHRGADIHVRDASGSTVLHTAVEGGNRDIVRLLLNHGADVHDANNNGENPLHLASKKQCVHIAEDLLYRGANINSACTSTWRVGYTPLHFSSEQGDEEAVKLFLNKDADINATTPDKLTPLHIAVKAERETVVKLLLEHGAKVDAQDKIGNTVLHFAVEIGNSTIVEDVLRYRPDINNQSNRNSLITALYRSRDRDTEIVENLLQYGFIVNNLYVNSHRSMHNAVVKGHLKIVENLLKCGAYANGLDKLDTFSNDALLHTAAINKQDEVATLLINYGANVNARNGRGKTPVFYAVQNNDVKITRLFLTNGADVKDSSELLHMATASGHLEIVEDLLKYDTDVNKLDNSISVSGGTLLHTAAINKQDELAKLLIGYGANVNAKDETGRTPLLYAVKNSDVKITRLLLTNGADIKDTPDLLCSAAENRCLEILEDLLKRGADVNILDHPKYGCGGTILHSAAVNKQDKVAKLLVNYGANVNAKDKRGSTPVFYAVQNNDVKITRLLLSNGAVIKGSPELLYTAAENECLEIVGDLLKYGADVNMLDHPKYGSDSTFLHSATINKRDEVAKLFISYGANVNAKDNSGKTPLFYAVQNSDTKITRLLLTNGADIKDTPDLLRSSAENGCLEIVEYLLKCGADVNMLDNSVSVSSCTLLHSAAINKQDEVAKLFITYGANVDAKDNRGKTPLFYAVQNSDTKITRLLLTNGADIKDTPDLLRSSAENGCLEIVEYLLKCGADVNMLDNSVSVSSCTLLHSAAINKQDEVAKLFITYGANVDAKDNRGKTPLFYAVQNSDTKITRLLLTNGADIIDTPDLLRSAAENGCLEIVEYLLKCGADVNMLDNSVSVSSCTLLHSAAINKQVEVAKLFITYGANVNAKDNRGKTPLFYAVQNSDAKITRLLLTNGADIIDTPDLLRSAAENGCLEIVEDLLECGADVNMLDHPIYGCGGTILHSAAINKQDEVAKLLVNYGTNVNAKDKRGRTPVYYTVQNNDVKITRLLLSNGADIKGSPVLLDIAAENECLEIVEDLLKFCADVDMSDPSKCECRGTPLHSAVRKNRMEVAKLLVKYGANVNAEDERGNTPLLYAVESSDEEIIRLLLTNGADIKDKPHLLRSAAENGCLELVEDLFK